MAVELFGAIIDGTQVESAVLDTLTLWEPRYLRELEEQKGLAADFLPGFRSSFTVSDDEPDRWPEDQLPSLIVACPGTIGGTDKDGEGSVRTTFQIEVGVVVSANDEPSTNRLAKWYAAVVRAILLQHSGLDGFARGLDWIGEDYDRVVERLDRSLRATVVSFGVQVDALVMAYQGPTDPDEVDEGPWNVESVETVATKETL